MKTSNRPTSTHHRTNTSVLDEYCDVSSCAGVIDLRNSKHITGKLIWSLILATALAFTSYQIYDMFAQYSNGGRGRFQTTITEEQMDESYVFPAVTICNFNRANKTKLRLDDVNTKVIEWAYGALPISYDMSMRNVMEIPSWKDKKYAAYEEAWLDYKRPQCSILRRWRAVGLITSLNLFMRHWNGKDPNVAQMLRKYGHDCDGTLLRLRLGGFEKDIQRICYYLTEVLTKYGRCFEYRTNESQTTPGPTGGLHLSIDPALREYPEDAMINNFLEQGVLISIGYQSESEPSNPIVISPGAHAYIAITATTQVYVKQKFEMFERPCQHEPYLEYVIGDYTPSNCRLDCLCNLTATLYGCVPILESKNQMRACTPNETCNKVLPFFDSPHFWTDIGLDHQQRFKLCESRCSNPCGPYTTIEAAVSTSKTFSSQAFQYAKPYIIDAWATRPFNVQAIEFEELVTVDIYFPELQYTRMEITEETPIITFVSNVGGAMGIWTGLCVMSLLQAVYYLFYGLVRICASKKINSTNVIRLKSAQTLRSDISRGFS